MPGPRIFACCRTASATLPVVSLVAGTYTKKRHIAVHLRVRVSRLRRLLAAYDRWMKQLGDWRESRGLPRYLVLGVDDRPTST